MSHPAISPSTSNEVLSSAIEQIVNARHSIRFYHPAPVDPNILTACATLAQRASSNSNTQPWRLHLAQGPARDRIVAALQQACKDYGGPNVPGIPEKFQHYRSEMGHQLYGPDGYDIAREDKEAKTRATMRNYEFFGAPVGGVVTMHEDLGLIDALGVGMFMEIFSAALTARGLGCCWQVSIAGFPEVCEREFGLGEELRVLCGVAIGYPDERSSVNNLVIERDPVEKQIVMLEE